MYQRLSLASLLVHKARTQSTNHQIKNACTLNVNKRLGSTFSTDRRYKVLFLSIARLQETFTFRIHLNYNNYLSIIVNSLNS